MSQPRVVSFRQMKDGTREDYALLAELEHAFIEKLPGRVIRELRDLEDGLTGYHVNRLQHSLISATMAERDGADLDWIVTALLHDIGDGLAPYNHDSLASTIIAPYVREECAWVMKTHGIFQLFYYGHLTGGDQHAREKYRAHPSFQTAVDFCERWDQSAFDPDYRYLPVEHFEPMVRKVFSRTAWDPAVIRPGVRVPLDRAQAA